MPTYQDFQDRCKQHEREARIAGRECPHDLTIVFAEWRQTLDQLHFAKARRNRIEIHLQDLKQTDDLDTLFPMIDKVEAKIAKRDGETLRLADVERVTLADVNSALSDATT